MRFAPRFAIGALAGALLLGSSVLWVPGTSAAAARKPATFAGQVSAVAGNTFTLTRTSAKTGKTVTLTVTLAPGAKEHARRGTTGPLANGEFAVVVGSRASKGAITANRVLYSTTAFKVRHHARHIGHGTYVASASSAASLVIANKAGKQRTFTITPATSYRVAGKVVTTPPTLTNGEKVAVSFKRDKATKSLVALVISVRKAA